jgi:hypothetical protein
MNSSKELVVETSGASIGPHIGPRVENPLLSCESFRTPPRIVREIYDNLGSSFDPPIISQFPEMYVTYTVPLDHFTSTTSNVTTFSNQYLIGSHSIPTLHMAHATMVPHAIVIL